MEDIITPVCQEKGWSFREFSIFCDCDTSLTANTVAGRPKNLSKKILKGLAELGYNPEEMAAKYQAYRASLREDIKAKLMATVG